ncbi:UNVERIFIED_CONTAM: hypothetical protein RMT77_007564 [Armadillidium vulgare]
MKDSGRNAQYTIKKFQLFYSFLKIFQVTFHVFLIEINDPSLWRNTRFVKDYFASLNAVGIIYSAAAVFLCWSYIKPFIIFFIEFAFFLISSCFALLIFHCGVYLLFDATEEVEVLEDKNYLVTTAGPSHTADPLVAWTDRILRKVDSKERTQILGTGFYFIVLAMFVLHWCITYYVTCKYTEVEVSINLDRESKEKEQKLGCKKEKEQKLGCKKEKEQKLGCKKEKEQKLGCKKEKEQKLGCKKEKEHKN